MRDLIKKRLTEYRSETLNSIAVAEDTTKAAFSERGTSRSSMFHRAINRDNENGFTQYMDRSANFISHVAGSSASQHANELRDEANKLKQEIMAKPGDENFKAYLDLALDKIVKRKVEDFELGYIEGKDMNAAITQNTVNIINSNISKSVVQITQSGKDTISKETAQKLEQLVNSEEIKGLPEKTRLDVLDQVTDLVKELQAPTTDKGKVHRGLKRLGDFVAAVASSSVAETVAQIAVAYATASGLFG